MNHTELESFLFVTGPLDTHANAFLAWLSAPQPQGTIVAAGHAVGKRETVTQPITGDSTQVEFINPAVVGKDLAFSKLKSVENGLSVASEIFIDEELWITGFHNRAPFTIPVRVHDIVRGKLILLPHTVGLAKPGMSGSAIVNEKRQVVGTLVRQGPTPDLLVAELLHDVR